VFLLFGTRTVLRHLATVRATCPYCGRTAPQEVFEQANRLTLFFLLPLFTFGRSYVNRCTNCGGETPLTADEARNRQDWAARHAPGR
jgi:uncharacterized Zn finger protein